MRKKFSLQENLYKNVAKHSNKVPWWSLLLSMLMLIAGLAFMALYVL